jgi:nucleoside-diphosphate-sugar epimerase
MKVLITGSTGFIGSKLKSKLQNSYDIITQNRGTLTNEASQDGSFLINIDRNSDWSECLRDVSTVIHLAAVAHNRSSDINIIDEVNFEGTIHLAKQSVENGVKRFIFISTIGVLGNSTCKPFDENSLVYPHSDYAISKLKAEDALLELAQETGIEVVIIRPVLVYGKGAPGSFGKLVNLVQKHPALPFGLCQNKRSFISIDNLVDFISTCVDHPNAKNEIFCISDGEDVSIRTFTDEISKGLNKRLIQIPLPLSIIKLLGKITGKSEPVEQLIGDLQIDSNKARQLLGWNPPFRMAETLQGLSKR